MPEFKLSRRKLLGSATLAGLAPVLSSKARAAHHPENAKAILKKGGVVFSRGFHHGRRTRQEGSQAKRTKILWKRLRLDGGSQLLISNPSLKLSLHNRGISGNKVHQLAARWDKDCLELKPDVLSILIGVNDIWHGLNGRYDGTVKTYEDDFHALLERTKKASPRFSWLSANPSC